MKKITLIKTMLLLFLMVTWTQVFAQDIIPQDRALTATDVAAGKTIAFKAIGVMNQKWVNWAGPGTDLPQEETGYFIVEDSPADDGIVLKRKSDNQYIGRNGNTIEFVSDKANAAVFTVSTPALDGTEVTGIHEVVLPEWASGKQIRFTNNDVYLNVQAAGSTPIYGIGKGSWSIVMVYDVTDYTLPEIITVNLNLQREDGTQIETRTVETFVGASVTVPTFDFRNLVSVKNGEADITLSENQFVVADGMSNITCTYSDALTFTTTTIEGTNFAAGTVWYQLSIHNTSNRAYLQYDATNSTVVPVKAGSQNIYDETQLWCFVGSADGVKVYNKAAGTDRCMTFNTDNVAMSEASELSVWSLVKTRSTTQGFDNAFCLKNSNTYINYNSPDNKIAYWGDNDDGSAIIAWDFESYVDNTLATMKSYTKLPIGTIGTPADGFSNVLTAIEKFEANPTQETENAVYAALNTNPVDFTASSYYRIMTKGRNNEHYMTAGSNMSGALLDNANASQIWKFEANGDNYKFTSQNVYATQPTKSTTVTTTTDAAAAQAFTVEKRADGFALYAIKPALEEEAFELHLAAELNIVGWNGGEASSWYLIPATEIDVEITDAGYATINYPFAVELPAELTAYTGGTISDNQIVLNAVEGRIIPANSPVILAGTAGTYTLTILPENTDAKLASSLQGTLLPQTIEETTTAYVLAKPVTATEVGFYKLNDTDRTIGANKAYLTVTAPAGIKAFTFDFGGTTGIENTEAVTEAEEYYDLQGRRVMNPTKGIYVTKSGKKVLFTK